MKILQINTVCGVGSTGRIAADLYKIAANHGHVCKIAYGRGQALGVARDDLIKIGSHAGVYHHVLMSRLTDKTGCYSKLATKLFIKQVKKYNPDIIHLHNIHGYYINIEQLFKYLAQANKKVVWTLHDCWAFTGHCAYFDFCGCDKWKIGCHDCVQKQKYPKSILFDHSASNYLKKKSLFNAVKDLTIVTPSEWLAALVKESFLKGHKVQVINNGIDLNVFKYTDSAFRNEHGLQDKFVILGAANIWDERKGFSAFLRLAQELDEQFRVVIVGLNEKLKKELPGNIIGISRTDSITKLAEIYSAADVFVNPTLEEVFGLVNVEALACGTPVITYDTGGSPECVDETCGVVIPKNDIDALKDAILEVQKCKPSGADCRARAMQFDKERKYSEYMELYKA
ncbi:MAG: glycosyltransferase [Oscillospiraceae bacterium]|nr:glycosyltransferase [Oscillospiraceae bacterium]